MEVKSILEVALNPQYLIRLTKQVVLTKWSFLKNTKNIKYATVMKMNAMVLQTSKVFLFSQPLDSQVYSTLSRNINFKLGPTSYEQ